MVKIGKVYLDSAGGIYITIRSYGTFNVYCSYKNKFTTHRIRKIDSFSAVRDVKYEAI